MSTRCKKRLRALCAELHIDHIVVLLFPRAVSPLVTYMCVSVCSKYYEREALMHDQVYGPILAALLGE